MTYAPFPFCPLALLRCLLQHHPERGTRKWNIRIVCMPYSKLKLFLILKFMSNKPLYSVVEKFNSFWLTRFCSPFSLPLKDFSPPPPTFPFTQCLGNFDWVIPGRDNQEDSQEFKTSWGYVVNFRSAWPIEWDLAKEKKSNNNPFHSCNKNLRYLFSLKTILFLKHFVPKVPEIGFT